MDDRDVSDPDLQLTPEEASLLASLASNPRHYKMSDISKLVPNAGPGTKDIAAAILGYPIDNDDQSYVRGIRETARNMKEWARNTRYVASR